MSPTQPLLGFVLLLATVVGSTASAQEATSLKTVVVASTHLDLGTILKTKDLKLEYWPDQIVPENTARSIEEIIGKCLITKTSKGLPLLLTDLESAQEKANLPIPRGMKVVSVKLGAEDVASLIKPGDHVDVICVSKTKSKTILKPVKVFATPLRSRGARPIVSLLVDENQAERLQRAKSESSRLKLVLRGELPSEDAESASESHRFSELRHQKIRSIARKLDQLAADLEDANIFSRADGLRKSAQQLRDDVRAYYTAQQASRESK